MHGNFRLANRMVMFLFKQTRESDFYFPRFKIALKACSVHFNIYKTNSGSFRVKPMSGHDTNRLFDAINEIIDYCLPISELDTLCSIDKLKEFVENNGLEIDFTVSDMNIIKTQIHKQMVFNGKHNAATHIKDLFKKVRDRYLVLQNGHCWRKGKRID